MLSYVLTISSSVFRWYCGHSVAHVQFLKHQFIMFDVLCAANCGLQHVSWYKKKGGGIYQRHVIICVNHIVKRAAVAPWPFDGPCIISVASRYYLLWCLCSPVFSARCPLESNMWTTYPQYATTGPRAPSQRSPMWCRVSVLWNDVGSAWDRCGLI